MRRAHVQVHMVASFLDEEHVTTDLAKEISAASRVLLAHDLDRKAQREAQHESRVKAKAAQELAADAVEQAKWAAARAAEELRTNEKRLKALRNVLAREQQELEDEARLFLKEQGLGLFEATLPNLAGLADRVVALRGRQEALQRQIEKVERLTHEAAAALALIDVKEAEEAALGASSMWDTTVDSRFMSSGTHELYCDAAATRTFTCRCMPSPSHAVSVPSVCRHVRHVPSRDVACRHVTPGARAAEPAHAAGIEVPQLTTRSITCVHAHSRRRVALFWWARRHARGRSLRVAGRPARRDGAGALQLRRLAHILHHLQHGHHDQPADRVALRRGA